MCKEFRTKGTYKQWHIIRCDLDSLYMAGPDRRVRKYHLLLLFSYHLADLVEMPSNTGKTFSST